MTNKERHLDRKERKAEEILRKEGEGIPVKESHAKISKDILRAQDEIDRAELRADKE